MVVLVAGEDSHTLEEREEKEGYGSCSSRGSDRGACFFLLALNSTILVTVTTF